MCIYFIYVHCIYVDRTTIFPYTHVAVPILYSSVTTSCNLLEIHWSKVAVCFACVLLYSQHARIGIIRS